MPSGIGYPAATGGKAREPEAPMLQGRPTGACGHLLPGFCHVRNSDFFVIFSPRLDQGEKPS